MQVAAGMIARADDISDLFFAQMNWFAVRSPQVTLLKVSALPLLKRVIKA